MKHTPTPWSNKGPYIQSPVEEGNETIAQTFHVIGEDRGMSVRNADFIVRAVNSHDQLKTVVSALLRSIEWARANPDSPKSARMHFDNLEEAAREALAAAGEQS